MASRVKTRFMKKKSAQRRRKESGFSRLPVADCVHTTKDLPRLAQIKPSQKILDEDLHKLTDPYFFRDSKFAITQKLFDSIYGKDTRTIGKLVEKTEAELLERPGIGVARLKKIKEALDHLGLTLKM